MDPLCFVRRGIIVRNLTYVSLINRSGATEISVRLRRNECSGDPKSVFGRNRNGCSGKTGFGVRAEPNSVFD
jgi:hypothetical protein